jgi:arginyl-tRNA synthetase
MPKDIEAILLSIIEDALALANIDKSIAAGLILDIPADQAFGDYSSNISLKLASLQKTNPLKIASFIQENIKKVLAQSPHNGLFKEIRVAGAGFINFYLSSEYFFEYLKDVVLDSKAALTIDLGKQEKVLIEFVSANPTGPLSVAHARQAAVGDALANIMSFLNFKVQREYYLNDEGNQINILSDSVALRGDELQGRSVDFPENYYQGDYIRDIAKEMLEKKLNIKDHPEYPANYILKIIKKELQDFGVEFDNWYSQKALGESNEIEKTLAFLKKEGFLYEQDGALWLKSTQFGDDKDRVVIKSDGSYTYLAPDIAYHQDKYRRGFHRIINLWGPDHHGYIKRLKASVEALGKNADSLFILIVQLATISRDGKPVQMSTRKGQYITLREVLDEVGRDASRFFFLMRRISSHLDFDLELAKKQTSENPVYYVQYAYARICSILNQVGQTGDVLDLTALKQNEELALLRKLWQFSDTLKICLKTQDPYMLTVYLQEVAESFHRFYDRHRVLGQDEKITKARTMLIKGTRVILDKGLELLGISRPQKM